MASRTQFKEKPSQLAHPLRYVVRVLSPNLLQDCSPKLQNYFVVPDQEGDAVDLHR